MFELFILLMLPAKAVSSMTSIEVAFVGFFNTEEYGSLSKISNVNVVHSGGMVADSGYDNYGLLNKVCRDEPVLVVDYNLNPVKNISKLSLLMKSQCRQLLIRLVVWVRTVKGEYYREYIDFKANSSSNTVNS